MDTIIFQCDNFKITFTHREIIFSGTLAQAKEYYGKIASAVLNRAHTHFQSFLPERINITGFLTSLFRFFEVGFPYPVSISRIRAIKANPSLLKYVRPDLQVAIIYDTLPQELLTQDNRDALIKAGDNAGVVAASLQILQGANLLSGEQAQANFDALIKAGNNAEFVAESLQILQGANLLSGGRAQANFAALINDGDNAWFFARALKILQGANLLSGGLAQANFAALIYGVDNAGFFRQVSNNLTGRKLAQW